MSRIKAFFVFMLFGGLAGVVGGLILAKKVDPFFELIDIWYYIGYADEMAFKGGATVVWTTGIGMGLGAIICLLVILQRSRPAVPPPNPLKEKTKEFLGKKF